MEKNQFFPEMKNRLGLGMMRLPMVGEEVDIPQTNRMVDYFLANGFNYFDTARAYISGRSEGIVRECLLRDGERMPRKNSHSRTLCLLQQPAHLSCPQSGVLL